MRIDQKDTIERSGQDRRYFVAFAVVVRSIRKGRNEFCVRAEEVVQLAERGIRIALNAFFLDLALHIGHKARRQKQNADDFGFVT